MASESDQKKNVSWKESFRTLGVHWRFYACYSIFVWGDNSWQFALSLALWEVGGSLQLPAVSNLLNSLAVLFLASAVGKWIDRTERLTGPALPAAVVSVAVLHAATILSAGLFAALLLVQPPVHLLKGLTGLCIFFSAVGILSTAAINILMTKDWIVLLSEKDNDKLAEMNAWMVRIDLLAMILAPLVVGQIMTSSTTAAGAIFVAGLYFIALPVLLFLLRSLHRSSPLLSAKKFSTSTRPRAPSKQDKKISEEKSKFLEVPQKNGQNGKIDDKFHGSVDEIAGDKKAGSKNAFLDYLIGWRVYFQQDVLPAALGLALLYYTVMGLDGITSSYIVSQGIKPNVLAGMRGAGALTGIVGSFLFVRCRAWLGLRKTGAVAFSVEIFFLIFCVLSIWLPGSPFDPHASVSSPPETEQLLSNATRGTLPFGNFGSLNTTTVAPVKLPESKASIWTFVAGLVFSRIGLWMADLSVIQVMQEGVGAGERGAVFGVQASLSELLSLLKDATVLALPHPHSFGFLILASVATITAGLVSYLIYLCRTNGKPVAETSGSAEAKL